MPARPGTLASQQEVPQVVSVVAVEEMSTGDFIKHARAWHRNLRYVTKNEHEALHRLRPSEDHVHENHIDTPPQPTTQTAKPEPKARARPSR